MDIYQMVAELRAAGFSQTKIAEECETTQATIGRIEHKKTSPNYDLSKRIEAFYQNYIAEAQSAPPLQETA